MQLEPHFLFNTLNAITTLVELGAKRGCGNAPASKRHPQKHPAKRHSGEGSLVAGSGNCGKLLGIEQVRFADRLRFDFRVDPAALDGLVSCFLLQPIMENAIHHGIAHSENDGTLEASATREGSSLRLLVRDTGSGLGKTPYNGSGIGLRSTRERLTHFYRDNFLMKAQPLAMDGFELAITIPYETSQR